MALYCAEEGDLWSFVELESLLGAVEDKLSDGSPGDFVSQDVGVHDYDVRLHPTVLVVLVGVPQDVADVLAELFGCCSWGTLTSSCSLGRCPTVVALWRSGSVPVGGAVLPMMMRLGTGSWMG